MMATWKKTYRDKINSLITGISEKQRINERNRAELQRVLLVESKKSLLEKNNSLTVGISEKQKVNERNRSELQKLRLAESKKSLLEKNNSLISGIGEKQRINEQHRTDLQESLSEIQKIEDRIKAVQKGLDGIILVKTLVAVNENDVILKRLNSDLEKIQSDLDSARIDADSKKSLQEKIDSLKNGISEKQKINDQYRESLKVEYFEDKIAEIKRLLDSIRLDSEKSVAISLSKLKQINSSLSNLDSQIREAAIDQTDKVRLLNEIAELREKCAKKLDLATRLSNAYDRLNSIIERLEIVNSSLAKGNLKELIDPLLKCEPIRSDLQLLRVEISRFHEKEFEPVQAKIKELEEEVDRLVKKIINPITYHIALLPVWAVGFVLFTTVISYMYMSFVAQIPAFGYISLAPLASFVSSMLLWAIQIIKYKPAIRLGRSIASSHGIEF